MRPGRRANLAPARVPFNRCRIATCLDDHRIERPAIVDRTGPDVGRTVPGRVAIRLEARVAAPTTCVARRARKPHQDRLLLPARADQRDFDGLARLLEAHSLLELRRALDRLTAERDDHVPRPNPGLLRGRVAVGVAAYNHARDSLQAHDAAVLLHGITDR